MGGVGDDDDGGRGWGGEWCLTSIDVSRQTIPAVKASISQVQFQMRVTSRDTFQ